jgi:hypothetical protein
MGRMHVNLLAVLVSAVIAFVIGAAWYSPVLFSKVWMSANRFTEEHLAAMRKGMMAAYGGTVVCFIVMAFVLAMMETYMHIARVQGGAKLGALMWLGFAGPVSLIGNLYSNRPIAAWLIDTGYVLISLVVMGTILAAWR